MRKKENWKAVTKSDNDWQLDGESVLRTQLEPKRPKKEQKAIVRLTHLNSLGRVADADIYVRVGDPLKPTDQDDLESGTDWVRASLIEDLVWIDEPSGLRGGHWVLRSKKTAALEDSSAWSGTYEAALSFPAGQHSIEIKIVSRVPDILRSLVLSGWELSVR